MRCVIVCVKAAFRCLPLLSHRITCPSFHLTSVEDEASELAVLKWLRNLNQEAQREGGHVHMLIGNHELMNVNGEFRYASAENIRDFGGTVKRKEAFSTGGWMAKSLANEHKMVLRVGDWLFVHAGLLPEVVKAMASALVAKEQEGQTDDDTTSTTDEEEWKNETGADVLTYINTLAHHFLWGDHSILTDVDIQAARLMLGNHGPVWTRDFSEFPEEEETTEACSRLAAVLEMTGAKHMVVGHTPQYFNSPPKGINSACGGKVWRIDIGMSRAFDPLKPKPADAAERPFRAPSALEIIDNEPRVLRMGAATSEVEVTEVEAAIAAAVEQKLRRLRR